MKVKDSGNRTKFDTGSHKDIQKGRGRYDLIPLEILSQLYRNITQVNTAEFIHHIYNSMVTPDIDEKIFYLNQALNEFVYGVEDDHLYNIMPNVALLFERGADKYTERDWEKGRPMEVYINSILRHFFQHMNNEKDEDHKTAVVWNIMACMDTLRRLPSSAYTLHESVDEK